MYWTGKETDTKKIKEIMKMVDGLTPADNDGKSEITSFRKLAKEQFEYDSKYAPEESPEEHDSSQAMPSREDVHKVIDNIESIAHKERKKGNK